MSSAPDRVLVTGGAGFIGSHLSHRLCQEGHHVRILDNFSTGKRDNISHFVSDVELCEGDIGDYESAAKAAHGCDVVFHEAALPSVPESIEKPLISHEANLTGTLNMLVAARDAGVRRFVFASSSAIYGADPTLPKFEDMLPAPISPYAAAKQASESYCSTFYEAYGLETVALRYFNAFGPRQDPTSQYASVIPKFITALLENQQPVVFGDGEQSRDFIYIDDIVEANLLAASANDAAGKTFNIACGEPISLNLLLDELRKLIGADAQAEYLDPRLGDVRHSLADITQARETLGFAPKADLARGLAETIGFYGGVSSAAVA